MNDKGGVKKISWKCFCGHYKKDHTKYINNGENKKGSKYVCTKDNCHYWSYCDLK